MVFLLCSRLEVKISAIKSRVWRFNDLFYFAGFVIDRLASFASQKSTSEQITVITSTKLALTQLLLQTEASRDGFLSLPIPVRVISTSSRRVAAEGITNEERG